MASRSLYKNSSIPLESQRSQVLRDGHELVGVLEEVEPVGGGLVKIRIAGLERLVAEELGERLRPMVGKRTSILRIGDQWSVVEVSA